jgi:hypothetical protein
MSRTGRQVLIECDEASRGCGAIYRDTVLVKDKLDSATGRDDATISSEYDVQVAMEKGKPRKGPSTWRAKT